MNVRELIKELEKMPADAEVGVGWESADRSNVDHVYHAVSGRVLLTDKNELSHLTGDDAPRI